MLIAKKLWPLMLGLSLVGCAASELDPGEAQDDAELMVDDEKADGLASVSTYFWARRDVRKCAFPMCGGYYVERVNKTSTRCADGVYRDACYVADLNFGSDRQSSGTLVVRGAISKRSDGYGLLTAIEAYTPAYEETVHGELPLKAFYRVTDRGLRCIHAPCPQFHRAKLNQTYSSNFDALDFNTSGANDDQAAAAYDALYTEAGVLATGVVNNRGGLEGYVLKAERIFLPLKAPTPKACYKGGCSGQMCSDKQGVISTCEWRPEYACYASASCELQVDGNCGWTQTPKLTACLGTP